MVSNSSDRGVRGYELSDLEREVIILTSKGKQDPAIGAELSLSDRALKERWARIRSKLGRPRNELVVKHFFPEGEQWHSEMPAAVAEARETLAKERAALAAVVRSGAFLATVALNNYGMVTGVCSKSAHLLGHGIYDLMGQPIDATFQRPLSGVDESIEEMGKAEHGGLVRSTRIQRRADGTNFEAEHELVALIGPFGQLGGFVRRIRDLTQQHVHELRIDELDMEIALMTAKQKPA